jgi:hypothetical protein
MQVCRLVHRSYSGEIMPPFIEVLVRKRDGFNFVFGHHWVWLSLYAVAIELFF